MEEQNIVKTKEDGCFPIPSEKIDRIITRIVINNLPDLISDFIFDKLSEKKTFEEIGQLLDLNRATVHRIYNGIYFPKKKKIKERLLKKYLELI